MKKFVIGVFATGMLAAASSAYAVPCGTGLDTSNVTFRGANSDACSGETAGNDDLNNPGNLGLGGAAFSGLARDNIGGADTSNIFANVKWTLTATPGTFGTYTLGWVAQQAGALPVQMDLAVVLKGGNGFASYLFNAEQFLTVPSSGSGTFTITFTNNGGQFPQLSHMSVYGRNPTTVCCEQDVPEPGSLALLGLGLLGLGVSRRRKLI